MTIVVYGIRNCSTMKKAFDWLDARGLEYRFHDHRKSGIDPETLAGWCDRLGWQALVNTRGTTWRKLPPADRDVADSMAAIALMRTHPSLIRRPVIETASGRILVGFDEDVLSAHLAPGAGT